MSALTSYGNDTVTSDRLPILVYLGHHYWIRRQHGGEWHRIELSLPHGKQRRWVCLEWQLTEAEKQAKVLKREKY
jgi:hypothetical protein